MAFLKQFNKIKKKVFKKKDFSSVYFQKYCNKYPVNKKIVLIESFHGQNISDSGLEFAREILKSYKDEYEVYFASEDPAAHQKYIESIGLDVKLVNVTKKEYVKILATAGYIFANTGLPIYYIKREGQVYLQTWHGTPLKTLGKKMRLGIQSLYLAQHGFLQADYLTQPNDFTKDIIMNDYNLENLYTGKVVMAGYPRNRVFFETKKGKELKEKLGFSEKTIYAYMPTWRGTDVGHKNINDYSVGITKIFKELDEYLTDDQIFFVRFHPILRDSVQLDEYKHILPFPEGVEPYEFINCCDALVTDYSSVFFDYSITKKPIILFIYDIDSYLEDRGINFDIRSLPFRQIEDTKELGEVLKSGAALKDSYVDTDYYHSFIKYDTADVTKRLLDMVFTGNDNGFEIYDYSHNKEKRRKVYSPEEHRDFYGLSTIDSIEDDSKIVWLYAGWFKKGLGEALYDHFNYSFDYVITKNTVPMTFSEKALFLMNNKKIVERVHLRDLRRTLPNLNVDTETITDITAFVKDCKISEAYTSYIPFKDILFDKGRIEITYEKASGYKLVQAVVLNRNNIILDIRDMSDTEQNSSCIGYNMKEMLESFTVFSQNVLKPGLIGVSETGEKRLFFFTQKNSSENINETIKGGNCIYYKSDTVNCNLPSVYTNKTQKEMLSAIEREEEFIYEDIEMKLCPWVFLDDPEETLLIRFEQKDSDISAINNYALLKKLSCKKDYIRIVASLKGWSKNEVTGVILKYRSKAEEIEYPLTYNIIEKNNKLIIDMTINSDNDFVFKEYYYDLFIEVDIFGRKNRIKVMNDFFPGRSRLLITNSQMELGEDKIIFPFYEKDNHIAFQYRSKTAFDTSSVRRQEVSAFITYILFGWLIKKRNIQIIYEKFSKTAQDNSYYYFKYCMDQLSDKEKKNIFYVIDKAQPDYEKIKEYDKNILQFMSYKHMLYSMCMQLFASTDAISHLYLWHTKPSLVNRILQSKKNGLFLQHGVTALKKSGVYFSKKKPNGIKYVATVSDVEQDIIVENWGYKENEVPILGFTRWDVLEDKSDPNDKFILVMPTWRGWLEDMDDEFFLASDYYKRYSEFINSKRLNDILKNNNVRLVFYLHPKFAEYISNFKADNVTRISFIKFGEEPLNDLMMKCSMLVTDYSSVCWDVLYIHKPVVFYQFDYDMYMKVHDSYIDMKHELPGERTEDENELTEIVEAYVLSGFEIKEEYDKMADRFFLYRDHENSMRTYNFITNLFETK